jgi:WD40 repeat protein
MRGRTDSPLHEDVASADAAGRASAQIGDYELLEEIARGGMGVVWRARQVGLNRIVALKMILGGRFANDAEVKRFRSEAEAAASLDHSNIVPLYEVAEQGGQHYFAMKLIEGGSLASRISNSKSPFSNEAAAQLLASVARAVHYAHQHGILHRDLKPANILLDEQGVPHVADFGLAKRVEQDGTLTISGVALGTPNYMSPEAAAGKARQLTTATDIYSLGAILYELLTGRPPFRADTPLATMRQVMETEPKRPSTINFHADRDLEIICLKCLEKEPARRYNSAAGLADDLERFLRHEPIGARPNTVRERVIKWSRRHPAIATLSTVLAVTFIVSFVAIVFLWQRAERETEHVRRMTEQKIAEAVRMEGANNDLFQQARAYRTSGQVGQRFKAIAAIAAAARIRPSIELRNEAIAAMALPDLLEEGPEIRFTRITPNIALDTDASVAAYVDVDNLLRLASLADGSVLTNRSMAGRPSGWLTLSSDRQWLAARSMTTAVFWNIVSGKQSRYYPAAFGMKIHRATEFSPDNRFLAIADGKESICLVDVESGEIAAELKPGLGVDSFKISPDGRHLAVAAGLSLQIWNLSKRKMVEEFPIPATAGVDWQKDGGRLALAARNEDPNIVDLISGTTSKMWAEQVRGTDTAILNPAGSLVAATMSYGLGMRLWSAVTGRLWLTVPNVATYGFSKDGTRLGFKKNPNHGTLATWSVAEGGELRSLLGCSNRVTDLDVSPDGRWLAAAYDDGVGLWKLASGQRVDFAPLTNLISVQFATDGQSLLAHNYENHWTVPMRIKERRFHKEMGFGTPEERRASAASTLAGQIKPLGREATLPNASATGLHAEIIFNNRIKLSDAHNGKVIAEMSTPDTARMEQLFFSRDGQRLMCLDESHFIHVWDLPRLRAELAKLNLDWSPSKSTESGQQNPKRGRGLQGGYH